MQLLSWLATNTFMCLTFRWTIGQTDTVHKDCPKSCRCTMTDLQQFGPRVVCDQGALDDRQFADLMMHLPADTDTLWIIGQKDKPNNFSMSQEFGRFPKIRELRLVRCALYTLGKRIFERLRSLRYLHLEDNIISHLTADTFDNTNHLHRLVLRNNRIALDTLPTGSFSYLRQLRHLDLSRNHKTARFASNIFSGMHNLKTLILSNLPLVTEDFQSFNDLPALEVLELGACRLSTIPPEGLVFNAQLKQVDLSYNQLDWKQVTTLLTTVPSLEALQLAGNHLHRPAGSDNIRGVFGRAKRLVRLDLADNDLARVADLGSLFDNTRLTEVNLCNNGLQWFRSSMLASSVATVQRLSLCDNHLQSIRPNLTANMTSLRELDLARNRLRQLPERLPTEFGQLEALNLSGNALSLFQHSHLQALGSLRVLDLSRCKFSRLPARFVSMLPSLDEIYLQGNPWNCRCEIGTLRELLLTNKPRPSASQVHCISPKDVQGLSVLQIDQQAFCAPATSGQALLGSGSAGSSAALVVIIVGMSLIVLLVNLTIVAMCVYNQPSGTYRTNEEKRPRQDGGAPLPAQCKDALLP